MSDSEKNASLQQAENASEGGVKQVTQVIDTVHQDEALKVLETYMGEKEWTAQEEKKLTRKIDWRLMPVLCLTYGLQYYDKAMLSQAVCILPSMRNQLTRVYSSKVHY